MEAANIRIDAPLLSSHQGKLVRIIGKCTSPTALESNGPVALSTTNIDPLIPGKFYEIIGKVSPNNPSVNVYSVLQLSDNVNMDMVSKLVQYVHKVPELFY